MAVVDRGYREPLRSGALSVGPGEHESAAIGCPAVVYRPEERDRHPCPTGRPPKRCPPDRLQSTRWRGLGSGSLLLSWRGAPGHRQPQPVAARVVAPTSPTLLFGRGRQTSPKGFVLQSLWKWIRVRQVLQTAARSISQTCRGSVARTIQLVHELAVCLHRFCLMEGTMMSM